MSYYSPTTISPGERLNYYTYFWNGPVTNKELIPDKKNNNELTNFSKYFYGELYLPGTLNNSNIFDTFTLYSGRTKISSSFSYNIESYYSVLRLTDRKTMAENYSMGLAFDSKKNIYLSFLDAQNYITVCVVNLNPSYFSIAQYTQIQNYNYDSTIQYNINLAFDFSDNLFISIPNYIFKIMYKAPNSNNKYNGVPETKYTISETMGGGPLVFDSFNNMYISDNNHSEILFIKLNFISDSKYDVDNVFLNNMNKLPNDYKNQTRGLSIYKDILYCTVTNLSKIVTFDLLGNILKNNYNTQSYPTLISVNGNGNICYYADNINFIVSNSKNFITSYQQSVSLTNIIYSESHFIFCYYDLFYSRYEILLYPIINLIFTIDILTTSGQLNGLKICYPNGNFVNGQGNDEINVTVKTICFKEGTKILCLIDKKEIYIPIEDIRENTFVKIYRRGGRHEFKKATCIMKSALQNSEKKTVHKLYKLVKEKNPRLIEDLYVTGGHAILYDRLTDTQLEKMKDLIEGYNNFEVHFENEEELEETDAERLEVFKKELKKKNEYKLMIEDKYKLIAYFDDSFEEVNQDRIYYIYHIVLENTDKFDNYAIYANGILTESTREVNTESLPGYEKRDLIPKQTKRKVEKREDINDKIQRYLHEKNRKKWFDSAIQEAEDKLIQKIQTEKNRTIKRKQQQLRNKTYRRDLY